MIDTTQKLGWAAALQLDASKLTECPLPDNCHDGRLDRDGRGQWKPATIAGIPCPLRCDTCSLGRRLLKKRIAAFTNRLAKVHYGQPAANPDDSAAIRALTGRKERVSVLCGGTGRGKDFAAFLDAINRKLNPQKCFSFRAQQFITVYLRQDSRKLWDQLTTTSQPYVIIEDLGTEHKTFPYSTTPTADCFSELIDVVVGSNGIVRFSTNLSPADLRERYGERFASRVNGHGFLVEIPDSEPDYRQDGE